MDGLIVLQPWANQIFDGTKPTLGNEGKYPIEYRHRDPPCKYRNVPIYILSQGYALGIVRIFGYGFNGSYHEWFLENIERFKEPRKYVHPIGARVWVKDVKIVGESL